MTSNLENAVDVRKTSGVTFVQNFAIPHTVKVLFVSKVLGNVQHASMDIGVRIANIVVNCQAAATVTVTKALAHAENAS